MKRLFFISILLLTAWLSASAYHFMVDGIAYNKNSDGKSVTVTYTDRSSSNYNGGSGNLKIPERVYYNGKYYTVTAIGNEAFDGCSGFTGELNIPNSVTVIGRYTFNRCSGLTSVTIGNSVTSIEDYAFMYCHGLTGSLNIPNSVTSIGNSAFYNCSGFTGSLNIPNSVTSIGGSAFSGCSGFNGSLTIPNSVTSIGSYAFGGCNRLNCITVDLGNNKYDSRNNCNAIIETTTNTLLYGCKNTTIPNSVTSIGNSAFMGCKDLTNVIIPNSVTSIGKEAFCVSDLTRVTIGNSVTSIGWWAFENCFSLADVYSFATTPPTIDDSFRGIKQGAILHVPSGAVSRYENTDWKKYFNTIADDLGKVTSLILTPTSLTLEKGTSKTLTATILPVDALDKTLNWTSSNTSVARVSSTGVVTAAGGGSAIITATTTDGSNKSASCAVTVKISATGISLSKTSLTLEKGSTSTLTATVSPTDATNKNVTWTSSNTSVATVSSTGIVTAIGPGSATITTTTTDGSNKSASCAVTVKISATGISLSKTSLTLEKGSTSTLTATVSPTDATNKNVTWTSSNTSVATVSSTGVVTAIRPGSATITATTTDGSNKSASCSVTVKITATGISLSKTSLTLEKGSTSTLTATVSPTDATNKNVTWTSSNTSVATVSSTGVVTAVGSGSAIITAKTADGSNLFTTCNVTVRVTSSGISLDKTTLTLEKGSTCTLTAIVSPSDATKKDVIWKSSNTAITTVDSNGKVTGVALGTATITATTTDGTNLSASCQVTVGIVAQEITLNKNVLSLYDGKTETLVATIFPSNTTEKNVLWRSSNSDIATVDNYGKVTGIAPGTATIIATTTDGTNLSAACQVTVRMTAKGISLNKTSLSLNDGQSETLKATVTPSSTYNQTVAWLSSNSSIATVDQYGIVTAIGPGTASITATTTDGTNLSASCIVTVFMKAKAISLNKTTMTINDGQREKLTVNFTPSNTTNKNVTWTTSNSAIATVDSYGNVTGIAPGETVSNVVIGSGIESNYYVPYGNYDKNSTTQTIYKAAELGGSGQIKSIAYEVGAASNHSASIKIYMGHKSGLFSNADDYVSSSALTLVYSGSPTLGRSTGWETITLNTPFNYNGKDNLVVVVCRQSSSYNSELKYKYTSAPADGNYCLRRGSDSNTDYGSVSYSSNYSTVTYRPNIKIAIPTNETATITATTTDGTYLSASCQVKVLMRAKNISLNKTSLTLNDGQTETLVATVTPENTSNKGVTWLSSDTTIAKVDNNGKVIAIGPGTVNITATTTDGTNLTATCKVTVLMKAKGISLNKSTLSILKGQSETLVATVTPSNTSDKSVTWRSSNTSVARVDEYGKVTAVDGGTATITATTADGTYLSAYCQVTVIVKATGITLNNDHITVEEEKSTSLYANITPYNITNKNVTWKSANPSIATVDSYGRVTGVTFGETTITATTTDGTNLSASCAVTVIVKKFYAETIDFFGGEDVTVPVKMRNSMEISGFQTEIYLPDEFSFAIDEDRIPELSLSGRASRNHTIGSTSTAVASKAIRVLSYSNTSKAYSGNDGDLFYFTLKSDWDSDIDTYYVTLDNSKLAKPDGEELDIDDTTIKLRCYYVPGDANHDKKVSISDIIAEARYILLQDPYPFHYKSANLNEDREISIGDIVLTANVILGRTQVPDKKFKVQRVMGGDALCANVIESRGDGSRTIAIALDGSTDYTAFQADLGLPAGMEITGARLSDRAGRSHSVAMNQISGNTVRVLAYASDNAVFAGNSGDLLLIDVKGHGNIEMTNALFAEPNGCEHEFDEMTFSTELSGINDITTGDNAPVNVYNTAGQLIRTNVNPETATQGLPAGFYLVGNKKVVVK
ncbi:MAG: Ig-like domain-containing protein [Muribaculaceae bacterium]|nr:Ig-like domain-containing protein [Muribaculaceae bacterium]